MNGDAMEDSKKLIAEMLAGLKRCRDYWQDKAGEDELNAPRWLDELIAKAEGSTK